ncbi:putative 3-hydroxyisobutyrate dehydrogenase [Penicillium rolfsii]|nr:putative 3-hydroxyisobutyrate dehydrogenase [Penicillium rolfsii]
MSSRVLGFIGLGVMGYPMARNLLKRVKAGTQLYVYDISEHVLSKFQQEAPGQVHICSSASEVAQSSDILFTIVPEGSHVEAVYLDQTTGVLASPVDGKILVDCSTIDPATSIRVRDAARQVSSTAAFYDAPVSGGSLGAAAGTLTFMLGCAEDDPNLALLVDLLGSMGSSIFPCGGFSLGLTAKLCNNYCSGLIAIATAEAMNIGIKSGMDPTLLARVFASSTAQSTINDKWNPVPGVCPNAPASKGYHGGFKVQLMKKDFKLAVEAAERVGAILWLGESGLRVYEEASEDKRCRGLDSRVVFRFIGGDEDWKEKKP